MSINIQIGNQIIPFPSSGQDENWSPAVIDFAQAVSNQLLSIASPFDVSPRVQTLTSDANSNLDISDATFPSGNVQGFSFSYSIYRTNGVTSLAEIGVVNGVYDRLNTIWNLQHEFSGPKQSDGTPYHTFSMNADQLQLTTVAIGGAYDSVNSKLSYAGKTILVNNI